MQYATSTTLVSRREKNLDKNYAVCGFNGALKSI